MMCGFNGQYSQCGGGEGDEHNFTFVALESEYTVTESTEGEDMIITIEVPSDKDARIPLECTMHRGIRPGEESVNYFISSDNLPNGVTIENVIGENIEILDQGYCNSKVSADLCINAITGYFEFDEFTVKVHFVDHVENGATPDSVDFEVCNVKVRIIVNEPQPDSLPEPESETEPETEVTQTETNETETVAEDTSEPETVKKNESLTSPQTGRTNSVLLTVALISGTGAIITSINKKRNSE